VHQLRVGVEGEKQESKLERAWTSKADLLACTLIEVKHVPGHEACFWNILEPVHGQV